MTKIIGSERTIELMVNCKTYPAVSRKYVETVCTGGIEPSGAFVRLYPVPFRFLEAKQQYQRWDVIRVRAYRDTKDSRPESWHLSPGAEISVVKQISSESQRWDWMRSAVHQSTVEMEAKGITNGCVEIEPISFYWLPDKKKWSASQLSVIRQGDLFATAEQMKEISEQLPWEFRLKFKEKSTDTEHDLKVLAWSYYQGVRREMKIRTQEESLDLVTDRIRNSIFNPQRTVFAIFGTHSRFGHWMISSLYYVSSSLVKQDAKTRRLFA
jgi:hypothetical protein